MKTSICVAALLVALGSQAEVFAQSLVGFWEGEGDATATVGTDGMLVNGAGFAPGQFGQGFSFSGASQQSVNVPGGGGLDGLSEGTISMWVQWNGTQDAACCGGTAGNVLARQSNGIFSNNVIGLNSTNPNAGGLTWQPYNAGGPVITGGTPVGDGTFRHVAVTFSNGHHALYLDGALQGTAATAGTMNASASVPLAIGAWIGDGGGFSTSVVDDVAVFNRELAISDIQALAGGGTRPQDIVDPISGVTATASSELGGGFSRPAANTVDGVGRGTIIPDGLPGEGNGMWLSEGIGFAGGNDTDPEITFDLGSATDIGQMVVYNYNETLPGRPELLGRGVDEAEILVSLDGMNFDSLGMFSFAIAPGDGTNPGQVVDLDVTAQYVRLDVISNHNGTVFPDPTGFSDAGFVGLNEVVFFEPTGAGTVIPEPATLTLLGLSLVGLSVRRRTQ